MCCPKPDRTFMTCCDNTVMPSASPSVSPTLKPTFSASVHVSQRASVPLGWILGTSCVVAVVLLVATRAFTAVIIRGDVTEADEAEATAAQKHKTHIFMVALSATTARIRARNAQLLEKSKNSLVLVLAIAAIQTCAAVGDITAVAQAAPALGIFANALDWASLMLPLPEGPLAEHWSESPEAVRQFVGILFWSGCAFALLLSLHLPVLALVRLRIKNELADENAIMEYHRLVKNANTSSMVRPSTRKPPDLCDTILNSFPKYEMWMFLLVHTGLSQLASAVLVEWDSTWGIYIAAMAVFATIVGVVIAVACFLYKHTRGPTARTAFATLTDEDSGSVTENWIDKTRPSTSPNVSCYRRRQDVEGRFWDGFTLRFGVCFAPFRPSALCGGIPTGLIVLLSHRALVGAVIGALDGDEAEAQTMQVVILLALYTLLGAWLLLARPFVDGNASVTEGSMALCIAAFLAVLLFVMPEADARGEARDGTVAAMATLLCGTVFLRIGVMLRASADHFVFLKDNANALVRVSVKLRARDKQERSKRRRRKKKRKKRRLVRRSHLRERRRLNKLRRQRGAAPLPDDADGGFERDAELDSIVENMAARESSRQDRVMLRPTSTHSLGRGLTRLQHQHQQHQHQARSPQRRHSLANGTRRRAPQLRKIGDVEQLPPGWIAAPSRSQPGKVVYKNLSTGEKLAWKPKFSAANEVGKSRDLFKNHIVTHRYAGRRHSLTAGPVPDAVVRPGMTNLKRATSMPLPREDDDDEMSPFTAPIRERPDNARSRVHWRALKNKMSALSALGALQPNFRRARGPPLPRAPSMHSVHSVKSRRGTQRRGSGPPSPRRPSLRSVHSGTPSQGKHRRHNAHWHVLKTKMSALSALGVFKQRPPLPRASSMHSVHSGIGRPGLSRNRRMTKLHNHENSNKRLLAMMRKEKLRRAKLGQLQLPGEHSGSANDAVNKPMRRRRRIGKMKTGRAGARIKRRNEDPETARRRKRARERRKKRRETMAAAKAKKEEEKRLYQLKKKLAHVLSSEAFFAKFGEHTEEYLRQRREGWDNTARGKVHGWATFSAMNLEE